MRTVKINEDNIVTVLTAGSLALLVLLVVAGYFLASLKFAASTLAGGLLAIANFYWMRSALVRSLKLQSAQAPKYAVLRYLARLFFLAVAVFVLMVYCKADIFGLMIGLSVIVFNIIALSLYLISAKGD